MKKSKISIIGLSTCLMLGMFTGCSTTETSEAISPATSAALTTEATVVTTESSTAVESTADGNVTESSVTAESSEDTASTSETSGTSQDTEPVNNDDGGNIAGNIDQEYANTFISNFVEVYFYDYDRDSSSKELIYDFAHIHLKINSRDSIGYSKKGDLTFETFTVEKLSSIATKYFGILLKDEDFNSLPTPPETYGDQPAGPYYEDGKIWYEAGDGESYNSIGIVDSVVDNDDGTLTLNFTVYSIDLDTYWQLENSDIKKYYKMTSDMAAKDSTLNKVKTGIATVGVTQSGDYYLISYDS